MLDDQEAPFGFVVFCLVIGVFLIAIPWHALWGTNFLLGYSPVLKRVALNKFVRGAVSGLGVIDVALGLAAFARLLRPVRSVTTASINSPSGNSPSGNPSSSNPPSGEPPAGPSE
ncbi:MAG TPA: hypothetical protein VFY29_18100 [Terriglobia bacterium]|nr:hypothetical protein [Terriglobia bacterium]